MLVLRTCTPLSQEGAVLTHPASCALALVDAFVLSGLWQARWAKVSSDSDTRCSNAGGDARA